MFSDRYTVGSKVGTLRQKNTIIGRTFCDICNDLDFHASGSLSLPVTFLFAVMKISDVIIID